MIPRTRFPSLLRPASIFAIGLSAVAVACGDDGKTSSGSTGTGAGPVIVQKLIESDIEKIDILLAIDNSASMGDKQAILADAVPDLVGRLVNPHCVGITDSTKLQSPQPGSTTDACNSGFKREFPPVIDINIGIVDSSLGGLGSDACPDDPQNPLSQNHNNNDHGHLVVRDASGADEPGQTYKGQGFLAWDPANSRGGVADAATLDKTLKDMVTGVGQVGCGYEQQLESWTRFLVDPKPYLSLAQTGGDKYAPTTPTGIDQTLLSERKNFLRPDSLLVIILLSDENDCSTRAGNAYFAPLVLQPFFKGSSECATNPNDPCCYSCALPAPSGCSTDPSCTGSDGQAAKYSLDEDSVNLRCWKQKERYGFSGLYPIQRYVNALTQTRLDPDQVDFAVKDQDNEVANPIFSDLTGNGGIVRDPSLVFLAGIVGVPWQDVAVTPSNLGQGFKDYDALTASGFWSADVGDPANYVYPTNSIMQEEHKLRSGISAATPNGGTSSSPNGGDRTISATSPNDLQFACIFKLPAPETNAFDCTAVNNPAGDSPLCAGTTQTYGKAYPGLRQLKVLQGLGEQGIPASICPANVTDPTAADYGYRPAVSTIVNRLQTLKTKLTGQCLGHPLDVDSSGKLSCVLIEAAHTEDGQEDCAGIVGRSPVPKDDQAIVSAIESQPAPNSGAWNDFCVVNQLEGASSDTTSALYECENNADDKLGSGINGWCYIDAGASPPLGNPKLPVVESCPANDSGRLIRFVNGGQIRPGATTFISCGN